MVKLGLLRDDSDRGVWELSDDAKALSLSIHMKRPGGDQMSMEGDLYEVARGWKQKSALSGGRHFIMMGETTFPSNASPPPKAED